jgi:hypothetical protein
MLSGDFLESVTDMAVDFFEAVRGWSDRPRRQAWAEWF